MRIKQIFLVALLLAFLPAILFAQDALVSADGTVEAPACIPRATADNTALMEKVCENRLHATCSCYEDIGGKACKVDFNENLLVKCDDKTCIASFLGIDKDVGMIQPSAALVQLICTNMAKTPCSCTNTDANTVSCTVKGAKIYGGCDDAGCTFALGELSRKFDFCPPLERNISVQSNGRNLNVTIEGTVIGEKDGTRTLQDGVISVSGQLANGIGIEIVADLNSIELDSNVNAQRVDLTQEIRDKFRQAVQLKYDKNTNFTTLDSIEINLDNLKDGTNIKSAVLRFKVPKSMVNGDVVILRYTEDGGTEVLTPTVTESGDYYIYEVSTGGLSLYAVATINQISEPISQGLTDDVAPKPSGCGTAAAILLVVGALYAASRKN